MQLYGQPTHSYVMLFLPPYFFFFFWVLLKNNVSIIIILNNDNYWIRIVLVMFSCEIIFCVVSLFQFVLFGITCFGPYGSFSTYILSVNALAALLIKLYNRYTAGSKPELEIWYPHLEVFLFIYARKHWLQNKMLDRLKNERSNSIIFW